MIKKKKTVKGNNEMAIKGVTSITTRKPATPFVVQSMYLLHIFKIKSIHFYYYN